MDNLSMSKIPVTKDRPAPFFIGGAPGIDFLNSIACPVDTPVEWIACGEDLLCWMQTAGLLPKAAAATLRKRARTGELDAIAARARTLREWFRVFVLEHRGRPLTGAALRELGSLNRLLDEGRESSAIVAAHGRLRIAQGRDWRSPDALVPAIARAIAEVICNEDFTHVKACEGPVCTLVYVDRTRSHGRRWCSMAVCGNREKQAVHRERNKERSR
jgi:predicted RNA-binding Zn ribbon-like protein